MKMAIITGASDGLGLELAKLLLKKNYEVVGISRNKPSLAGIKFIKADFTKDGDIRKVITTIKKDFPDFDFLINCAGIMSVRSIDDLNYTEVENLFRVNVFSQMMLVSGLMDNIKKNGADIVNVCSTVGFKAYENQLAYGSSKWAVRGINENLRLELKGTKSRVIGFSPGGFKSRIFEKATGIKPKLDAYMEPAELAKLIVQLLELPKNMEVSDIIINRK
jgi:short-subunit dehydrogenase